MIKIAPSLLASDFSRLGDEIRKVEKAGVDLIHIDVMDGHFVPSITIGPPVLKSLRPVTRLTFDVHLMLDNPDYFIDSFIDAGADIISVHVEACRHLHGTVQKIKNRGKKACVALNPATPLSSVEWVLNDVDMVLLMTVNPGFGGQAYIESVTEKISQLKEMINKKGLMLDIEVDGGIDLDNIYKVTRAGANVIVSGTTIFNSGNVAETIEQFRRKAYSKCAFI